MDYSIIGAGLVVVFAILGIAIYFSRSDAKNEVRAEAQKSAAEKTQKDFERERKINAEPAKNDAGVIDAL